MTAPLFELDHKPCEHCGQQFKPRKHGGGKPQRFCSTNCRHAFRTKHRPIAVEGGTTDPNAQPMPPTRSMLPAIIEPPSVKSLTDSPEAPEASYPFSWSDTGNVILRSQLAVAIYWNANGDLTIRQERDAYYEEDDTIIVINRDQLDVFIDQLTDIAGIPSVGT